MTDRHPSQPQGRRSIRPTSASGGGAPTGGGGERPTLLGRIQDHAPNSTQLVGLLTLLISGGILLILTGITITATIMGLIFFTPLIILSSPIWIPVGTVLFLAISGFLTISGFGVSVLGGSSWMYKYLRGRHPPGSDRIDYARSRIADTASHVKDYVQSKVKDAAPSA